MSIKRVLISGRFSAIVAHQMGVVCTTKIEMPEKVDILEPHKMVLKESKYKSKYHN